MDNRIFDSHTEIIMRFPCIGINLLMVFMLFIFVSEGSKRQKLYYSVFGLILLILVNAIRVALLYAFIYDGIPSASKIDWHDLFNVMVYLSIFALWMNWVTVQNKLKDNSGTTINHKD
jgi:exosortase/archaeosortase family protein